MLATVVPMNSRYGVQATSPFLLALILTLGSCAGPSDKAPDDVAPARVANPPAAGEAVKRIGKIDALDGEAVIVHDGKRIAATAGFPVFPGDMLETGPSGKVQVTLLDNSVVAIGGGSKVEITELLLEGAGRSGSLAVAVGKFWMRITQWKKGDSRWEIQTPNAVAGVRGTTLWGSTEVDAICALEGTIEVRSRKDANLAAASLTAGNCASELSHGKLTPLAPDKATIDAYLKEVLIPSAPR